MTDHIAEDSPYYAAAFGGRAIGAAKPLATLAKRGRMVPDLDDPEILQILVKGYRLIYTVTGNTVVLLAFIHDARDLLALWDDEERLPQA